MKLTRNGKINYLAPDWLKGGLQAGFTTRNGGVSRAPYNSLNLGFNTEDVKSSVEGNRSTLARAFGFEQHQLLTVRQVHGNDILVIDQPNPDLTHFQQLECDAIISNQPGMMIGVLVADCYPVLLAAPAKGVFAAVHVGWRGAAARIVERTVDALIRQFEVLPDQLFAAVGPGIGAHSYEVDRPVRDQFRKAGMDWSMIAEETGVGHWKLDLRLVCQQQLQAAGVADGRIDLVEECTCCHKQLFFSHRRDHGQTGRQLGFICLA
jgi:YfiH family protein